MPELMDQIRVCNAFLRKHVPGFEAAVFSGVAPRIGIRETRRIVGEEALTGEDVLASRRRADSVARGAHEIDMHAAGSAHTRQEIPGGSYYDIPFGTLVPRGLRNVLVAGRCLSSTREGQSSARVMGPCLAMGQAVGTAAAAFGNVIAGNGDVRDVPLGELQNLLRSQGALI
ncbi:FAD-dependent oxidoreductase [Chelatococcus asaccharovorans]|uniref:FAD-dependent oxidoreductase n=1 Tax=Chelatococcus asaccharovorans TaxID=28210 RepID=UPI002264AE77|nr:FAD-dependent oxidoreductase [Chelatococcus asaccharovorans]